MVLTFEKQSDLPFTAETVFGWHERPGAFERLNPPWQPAELIQSDGGIADGSRVELRVPVGPFRRRWVAEHRNYVAGEQFQDVQIQGPFAKWIHTHTVEALDDDRSRLIDAIDYQLPGGFLGGWLGGRSAAKTIARVFEYRHRTTRDDLAVHSRYSDDAMKILISGSSGLVGSELRPMLTTGGHEVARLTRPGSNAAGAVVWNPAAGEIDRGGLEGFDAVVHLAGENIGDKRWSKKQKARIRDSRVEGTQLLAEALAGLKSPPRVLVCASAIGYYGDRGDEMLEESSKPGTGFLPEVCAAWEAAADPARQAGIRVVHLRFGVVLSPKGGALKKMLLPFKLGGGGVIGGGKQFWSWVAIDDVLGAILHALATEGINGPVNVVAPNPATNREFTKMLGRVLKRPTILPMPGFLARLLLGEMADDLLLASANVEPNVLRETNYEYRFPDLEPALRHLLGR